MAAGGAGQRERGPGGDPAGPAREQDHRAGAERRRVPGRGERSGHRAAGDARSLGRVADRGGSVGRVAAQLGEELCGDLLGGLLGVDVHGADQGAGEFEGRAAREAVQTGSGCAGRGDEQQPGRPAGQGAPQRGEDLGEDGLGAGPQGGQVDDPVEPRPRFGERVGLGPGRPQGRAEREGEPLSVLDHPDPQAAKGLRVPGGRRNGDGVHP